MYDSFPKIGIVDLATSVFQSILPNKWHLTRFKCSKLEMDKENFTTGV